MSVPGARSTTTSFRARWSASPATTFALDAIYAEQREVVPKKDRQKWLDNRTARWRQIYETLRRAFRLRRGLRAEMQWLFERDELGRDFLVHPDAEFREPADHPLLPNTTAERSRPRAENATRAVDLLMEVLEIAITSQTRLPRRSGRVRTPASPSRCGLCGSGSVADRDQVLRFAVGTATGPRSRTWRLWVPKGKSDVFVSSRRLGNSVKVSLHEPGPSRFALTNEFVNRGTFQPPEDRDRRLAHEWERPRTQPPNGAVRPLALIVPWDEVRERDVEESGDVVWVPPPSEGTAVHFDVVYVPVGMPVTGHPGARSMGTQLVGMVDLENGERVYVTWLPREMDVPLRENIERLRSVRVLDAEGNVVRKTGMLGFGTEPNPDAADGTEVATLVDVTRPDEVEVRPEER